MPRQLTSLKVFVASSDDLKPERDILGEIVSKVNRDTAWPLGLNLELWRWEVDARPGFHTSGPQGLIDQVSGICECDILIGIFWKRLGTGTAQEFTRALESWRRAGEPSLMIYFNEKAYTPTSREEIQHLSELLDFKTCFPKEGLAWKYDGAADFGNFVSQHLRSCLRDFRLRPGFEFFKPQQGLASLVLKGMKEEYYRALDRNMASCPPVRFNVMVPDTLDSSCLYGCFSKPQLVV